MSDATSGEIQLDVNKISQELRIRPEVYVRIVSSYAKSLMGKLKLLDEALSVNDSDQMRMLLHEIKGTAGNLRLKGISEAEAAMHVAVKAGETEKTIGQYFEVLRVESEKLLQYVNRLSPG